MMIKGYVVRGKWRDGRDVYAFWWATIRDVQWTVDRDAVPKDSALLFATIGDAIGALLKSSHLVDVRIFAVAQNDAETPLRTYEEALAAADKAAKKDAAWARLVLAQGCGADSLEDSDAAKQTLRDLGADVDALLSD